MGMPKREIINMISDRSLNIYTLTDSKSEIVDVYVDHSFGLEAEWGEWGYEAGSRHEAERQIFLFRHALLNPMRRHHDHDHLH